MRSPGIDERHRPDSDGLRAVAVLAVILFHVDERLVPGGVLLYETFTEHQLRYDRGPRSRAHLLAPGELRLRLRGMDVLFDEEVMAPDAVARIAARRRQD